MLEFEKITTNFSEEQDRIIISAALRDGGTARIWLTQRMINRLIPVLVNAIKPRHKDPIYVDIIAGASLTNAVARQEPQTPVRAKEPEHEWLVRKIDLQTPASGIIVIFHGNSGQSARIGMKPNLLRQWLSILQKVYFAAEWRGTDWPDWMSVPLERKAADRVLH